MSSYYTNFYSKKVLMTAFVVETIIKGKNTHSSSQDSILDQYCLRVKGRDSCPVSTAASTSDEDKGDTIFIMTRYVPAGIKYDNKIDRELPSKSQTMSIDDTALASAPADQKITTETVRRTRTGAVATVISLRG